MLFKFTERQALCLPLWCSLSLSLDLIIQVKHEHPESHRCEPKSREENQVLEFLFHDSFPSVEFSGAEQATGNHDCQESQGRYQQHAQQNLFRIGIHAITSLHGFSGESYLLPIG